MKQVMRGLALAAMLLAPSVGRAEFVIDTFTSAASTGFDDTTRSALTSSNLLLPGTVSKIDAGTLTLVANAAAGYGEFTLNFANPGVFGVNPVGWGYYHTIQLRDLAVAGDWQITVSATNGVSPVGTLKTPVVVANGSTSAVVELTGLDHVSNLNSLQSLTFRFTNLTDAGGNRLFTAGSFAAVPEPASMGLLGLTAIGGVLAYRRRKLATPA